MVSYSDSYEDFFLTLFLFSRLGQAEAIKLGISRALAAYNPEYKNTLSNIGFLERDCRKRERKKPGRKRARKMFTWVRR